MNDIVHILRSFKSNKALFLSGKYKMADNARVIYNVETEKSKKEIEKIVNQSRTSGNGWKFFIYTKMIRLIVMVINLFGLVVKNENQKEGKNIAIMKTGSSYIFFNYRDKKVRKRFESMIDFQKEWKSYFDSNFTYPMLMPSKNEELLEIEMPWYEQCDVDENLNNLYELFLSKNILVEKYNNFSQIKDNLNRLDFNGVLSVEKFKIALVHGDLWRANILTDGKNYYVIDFEHAHPSIFYYDFFYFIFSEYKQYGHVHYLRNYLKGDYDSLLEKKFSQYGECYSKKYRSEYLIIFYAFYLTNFEQRGNDSQKELNFIKQINKKLAMTVT